MANAFLHIAKIRACSIGVLLAAGLLWPAQGSHAYCISGVSPTCEMEELARAQVYELQRLNDQIREMGAEQRQAERMQSIYRYKEIKNPWRQDLPSSPMPTPFPLPLQLQP
jgi:hypothetical protein